MSDSRRLQYMSRYGMLRDGPRPPAGQKPQFLRSLSEPFGTQHAIYPPSVFSNPLENAGLSPQESKPSPTFSSIEEPFGDSRQPLIHHSLKSRRPVSDVQLDFFPYLSYVVTLIHLIVFIVHWSVFGFTTSNDLHTTGAVTLPNGSTSPVCWSERGNVLLGPRGSDLIRAGAVYPPCMRFDPKLHQLVVQRQWELDRVSGCCISHTNTRTSCYQTSQPQCSAPSLTWLGPTRANRSDQTTNDGDEVPTSGPVCGLDPEYCLAPRSTDAMPWSKDITKWPVCEHSTSTSELPSADLHMQCAVTGRPCCFGQRGECVLTTREHCDFIRGSYHPKASLCSQVNCLKSVCGLGFFLSGEYPDQFYRIFSALFIHSGLIPLVITVWIQLTFMCNLERFLGPTVVGVVYFLSGCFGNLMSGYFLPYQVGSGPAASLMGLAGLRAINYFFYPLPQLEFCNKIFSKRKPRRLLFKLRDLVRRRQLISVGFFKNVILNVLILVFGTLPWIDNFAILGGFISGTIVAFVVLPYKALRVSRSDVASKSPSEPRRRYPVEVICSLFLLSLFIGLFCLFTFGPILHCDWCTWFTCIPLAPGLCDRFYNANTQVRSQCVPEVL